MGTVFATVTGSSPVLTTKNKIMIQITWTQDKKDKAIEMLTKYFEKYGIGECIMQSDDAIIYATELLSDIADNVLIDGEGIVYISED